MNTLNMLNSKVTNLHLIKFLRVGKTTPRAGQEASVIWIWPAGHSLPSSVLYRETQKNKLFFLIVQGLISQTFYT